MGGGIYFNNDGLNIASSKANPAVIQQNKKVESVDEETGTANNIYVYTGQTIKIGKLQDGCKIGISEEVSKDDITFTAGYEQNNKGVHPSRYFTSDDSEYLTDYIRNEDMTEVRLAKGAIITFKVQNGTWSDGTTGDRIVFVNYAAGTSEGTLSDSEIPTGMLPIEGYDEPGAWNSEINKTVSEEMTYIYSFTKNTADSGDSSDSSDSPDVSDPGETETPKTGDESNIALWFAVMITACAVLSGIAVCNKNKKSTK